MRIGEGAEDDSASGGVLGADAADAATESSAAAVEKTPELPRWRCSS